MSIPDDNVVRLFFDEADLERAWTDFDLAMRRLYHLYDIKSEDEGERRAAANECARAEAEFRHIFARLNPRLTRGAE